MTEPEFFSISDLARDFDVTLRTIRFYEEQGLIEPQRDGRQRVFNRRDRARLKLILRGKRIGLSLQEIRELFALYDAASDDAPQLHEFIRILQRKEQQLLEQMEDIKVVLSEISQLRHQCEKTLDRRGTDARQST